MSNKEAVLHLLKADKTGKFGPWVDGNDLKFVGGSEALRRVRELRAEGYNIENRPSVWGGPHEYRLVGKSSK